jgi:hypothetical protein
VIELGDGFYVQPSKVAAVKDVGDGKCAVFTEGQSAIDGGFLVEGEAVDIADKIDEALAGEDAD